MLNPSDEVHPGKPRILWVDDDLDILRLYVAALQRDGFDVDLASTTELATKKLKNTTYDLIIVDDLVPNDGGIELIRTLRNGMIRDDPKVQSTPVLLFSCSPPRSQSLLVRALNLSCDVMFKPDVMPNMLAAQVRTMLGMDRGPGAK